MITRTNSSYLSPHLSPVSDLDEVEVEMQNTAIKNTLKPMPVAQIPLLVDNLEGDVLVRGPGREFDGAEIMVLGRLQSIRRRLALVYEVRVEDVELIAQNFLWRRIFEPVPGLVDLVPLITHFYSVEVVRLSRPEFLDPVVLLLKKSTKKSKKVQKSEMKEND